MDTLKALEQMQEAYGRLHDFLSDAIEAGRLTEADIPDDYAAIVEQLAGPCNAASEAAKAAIAAERAAIPTDPLAALELAESLIEEAIEVHIYGDDETPDPECNYTQGLVTIRAAIAKAKEGSVNA